MLVEAIFAAVMAYVGGLASGFLWGFHRGIDWSRPGDPHEPKPASQRPQILKAFGRQDRHVPKYVSEEEQARREARMPPADPGHL